MKNNFNEYLKFHRENGGTGKLFKFKFLEYETGFLKLEGEFNKETIKTPKLKAYKSLRPKKKYNLQKKIIN